MYPSTDIKIDLNPRLIMGHNYRIGLRGMHTLLHGVFRPVKSRRLNVHPRHTPSIDFRHLPPNSARIGYASKGALFISTQLSTDTVSALRKVWVLIKLQTLVYDIRKAVFGVRRQVPESGVRSVGSNKTVEAT